MTSIEAVRRSNRRILAFAMVLLLCLGLLPAAAMAADDTSANVMTLMDWDGTVTVKTSSGTAKTARKGMNLYSGYTVSTGKDSKAWIGLDGTKSIRLNKSSSVEVRKSGKKLDVLLNSGEIFFNSDGQVGSDANYNIITQTAICGVRGSFGWINGDMIALIHGYVVVEFERKPPVALTDAQIVSGDLSGSASVARTMRADQVPSFVTKTILEDASLQQIVNDDVDAFNVKELEENLPAKEAEEKKAEEEAARKAEEAQKQQEATVAANAAAEDAANAAADVPEAVKPPEDGGTVPAEDGGAVRVVDLWDDEGNDVGPTTTDDSGATTGGSGGGGGSSSGSSSDPTPTERHGYLSLSSSLPEGVDSIPVTLTVGSSGRALYDFESGAATAALGGSSLNFEAHAGEEFTFTVGGGFTLSGATAEVWGESSSDPITLSPTVSGGTCTVSIPSSADVASFLVGLTAVPPQNEVTVLTAEHGSLTATYGSDSMDADGASVTVGTEITVWAAAMPGYEIPTGYPTLYKTGDSSTHVTGVETHTLTGSDETYWIFPMPAFPVTVDATFALIDYAVTVDTPTNGTLAANKTTANYDNTVTLTVTPATGYELDELTVSAGQSTVTAEQDGSDETKWTFSMPASDVTASATFRKTDYAVTVNTPVNGTLTANKETANIGDTVTLTVTPATDYTLDALTVSAGQSTLTATQDSSDETKWTFTMTASPVTVGATFRLLDAVSAPTADTAAGEVAAGAQVTLSCATAGASVYYTTDGSTPSAANGTLYTAPITIDADKTIKAIAVKDGMRDSEVLTASYTALFGVSITTPVNGTLTADPTSAAAGATVTLTVTPGTGYEIDTLTVKDAANNEPDLTHNSDAPTLWTFSMPAGDVTASATFKPCVYPIKLNAGGGTVADMVSNYTYGVGATLPTNVTLSGSRFEGWYDAETGGNKIDEIGPEATGDKEYWARWTQLYAVTVTTPQNGTLTADKESAAAGETVTLTVTPDTGCTLSSLTVTYGSSGTLTPTQDTTDTTKWTFPMPAGDATVTAEIAAPHAITFQLSMADNTDLPSDCTASAWVGSTEVETAMAGDSVRLSLPSKYEFVPDTVTYCTTDPDQPTTITPNNAGAYFLTMPDEAVTVTAQVRRKSFTLTYTDDELLNEQTETQCSFRVYASETYDGEQTELTATDNGDGTHSYGFLAGQYLAVCVDNGVSMDTGAEAYRCTAAFTYKSGSISASPQESFSVVDWEGTLTNRYTINRSADMTMHLTYEAVTVLHFEHNGGVSQNIEDVVLAADTEEYKIPIRYYYSETPDGKTFAGWYCNGEYLTEQTNYNTLQLPKPGVYVLDAQWGDYTIDYDDEYGRLTVPFAADEDTLISFEVRPSEGYMLDPDQPIMISYEDAAGFARIEATYDEDFGTYSFTMPGANVQIDASFTAYVEPVHITVPTSLPNGAVHVTVQGQTNVSGTVNEADGTTTYTILPGRTVVLELSGAPKAQSSPPPDYYPSDVTLTVTSTGAAADVQGTLSDISHATTTVDNEECDMYCATYTFTMPAQDLTATPAFGQTEASGITFAGLDSDNFVNQIVLKNSEDKTLWFREFTSADDTAGGVAFAALPGKSVTLFVYTDQTAAIDTVTVNGEAATLTSGYATFTMPESGFATVVVTFRQ